MKYHRDWLNEAPKNCIPQIQAWIPAQGITASKGWARVRVTWGPLATQLRAHNVMCLVSDPRGREDAGELAHAFSPGDTSVLAGVYGPAEVKISLLPS